MPMLTRPDGTIAYTRDGSFQLDSQGRMVNSNGLLVQGGITVPANATNLSVAANGWWSGKLQPWSKGLQYR